MSELELQKELFKQLDEDTRELLTTIHLIKINKVLKNEEKAREEIVRARWLAQRINDMLFELG